MCISICTKQRTTSLFLLVNPPVSHCVCVCPHHLTSSLLQTFPQASSFFDSSKNFFIYNSIHPFNIPNSSVARHFENFQSFSLRLSNCPGFTASLELFWNSLDNAPSSIVFYLEMKMEVGVHDIRSRFTTR